MKYLSALIVFCVLLSAGFVNAQSATGSGSKSYTYVMKKIDGSGAEIIDKLTISGNTLTSEKYSQSGFKSAKAVQKTGANGSAQLEATLQKGTKSSVKYSVAVTDNTIDGTVVVVDDSGVETTMAIRGMSTEEWENIQGIQKDSKEKQKQ